MAVTSQWQKMLSALHQLPKMELDMVYACILVWTINYMITLLNSKLSHTPENIPDAAGRSECRRSDLQKPVTFAPAVWEQCWNKRDLPRQSPESHFRICWLNPQVGTGRDKLMILYLEIKLPFTIAGKMA